MGTMVEKGQGVISTLSQYALSFEQKLLHFTFAWVGALEGIIHGSFKGARSLQPHFTSTEGFQELVYGSRHKAERQHQSITDLLKSWMPNFSSSKQQDVKQICGSTDGLADYSKTNGAAQPKEYETAVVTDPTATAPHMPAKDFTPQKMTDALAPGYYHTTDDVAGHHNGTNTNGSSAFSTPAYSTADSYSSKGGSPVHAGDPSYVHDPSRAGAETVEDAEDDEDDVEVDSHEGDEHLGKRKKAAKKIKAGAKKVGEKIKKVFEPIIINSNKEHGGMIGGCTHPATK